MHTVDYLSAFWKLHEQATDLAVAEQSARVNGDSPEALEKRLLNQSRIAKEVFNTLSRFGLACSPVYTELPMHYELSVENPEKLMALFAALNINLIRNGGTAVLACTKLASILQAAAQSYIERGVTRAGYAPQLFTFLGRLAADERADWMEPIQALSDLRALGRMCNEGILLVAERLKKMSQHQPEVGLLTAMPTSEVEIAKLKAAVTPRGSYRLPEFNEQRAIQLLGDLALASASDLKPGLVQAAAEAADLQLSRGLALYSGVEHVHPTAMGTMRNCRVALCRYLD